MSEFETIEDVVSWMKLYNGELGQELENHNPLALRAANMFALMTHAIMHRMDPRLIIFSAGLCAEFIKDYEANTDGL